MRIVALIALGMTLMSCGVEPGRPPLAGSNELQPRSGIFSGESGDFLILGTDPPPASRDAAAAPDPS